MESVSKLMRTFDVDPYPDRPRILFIGLPTSTHTHSWIDLLDESEMNVRLFALSTPGGIPPENWKVRTYVTAGTSLELDPSTRARLYPLGRVRRLFKRRFARHFLGGVEELEHRWLAQIICRWRPDVIHTLGLDSAGYFYFRVRNRFELAGIGTWVLQLRGGSDLTLSRLDPEASIRIGQVLRECDQLVSDNEQNFDFALEMGARKEQISSLGTVPGTGGVDVTSLAQSWHDFPSSRRIILWPKAYECPWSKALPVFEALKLAWGRIQPCELYMLAMNAETRMWYWALPERIRQFCHAKDRIPQDKVLELMVQARVMLAPSLVDGTPNSMFEAMAAGAFPIVSPLETMQPLVENEQNVLFARNLYPHEIAEALCRAMSDDALVDSAAEINLELVRRRADRSRIRPRVIEYYERLAAEQIK
jgi:glycosyltransferase involved in cell wall biosynthesis